VSFDLDNGRLSSKAHMFNQVLRYHMSVME